MHDERADRQLTRADFGDNESWAKYLRTSCLTSTDEAGRSVWTYIGGDGPEATLHRAIHGATRRQHQLAFEGYGATSYIRRRDFVKVYDAVRLERYPSELNRGRDSRIGFDLLEDSGRGKEAAGDGAF